ncbi:nucleoside recognition domain-containing protein [Aneurinibacillus sp. Ricciae_BoGa-3]|uniref:nucleoside recognition domain-containing protein n=1 Tax=Aneurinibacillus sp. Ricciae_BoGa-3 TaxID=3022697 RepID=UPI00233F834F|nr:nucleoside recognition domain-containing protein [Aneurinibacillus sp. Ricciae_BoGa-3]WCK56016.1 nucleoside recognition domain-containing protein [Aneurinibacillus sp. Ricciae_BoGa-3]
MVNIIWAGMILLGLIYAAVTGHAEAINKAVFEGAKNGVAVSFGLMSILIFWMGVMKIAEDAGVLDQLARLLGPFARWLFPSIPKDHPAFGYILSNMSANLLGLGNAATPMGIKAMQELQKLNPDPKTATPAMCTLLALNTASITLIPTTLIAIRMNYKSANPAEIVGTTLLATFIATGAAIVIDKWFQARDRRRG